MKWLIIQSAGEHDGIRDKWTPNDYLRECFAIKYALETNKQEADIWGLRHSNFKSKIDFEGYDIILCIENYEIGWLPDFKALRKPLKLQWCIDLHCGGRNRLQKITPNMDMVLHSTRSLLPAYAKLYPKQKHVWFPNGVDDRYFFPKNLPKKENIVFVAHPRNRGGWIKNLAKDVGMKHYFETGRDMFKRVSEAKVHFNVSISCDVNYRCFETIGLGTALLTNYIPEMEDLGFRDGINCKLFKTYAECVSGVGELLKDNRYVSVGENGYTLSKEHTYTKRIKDLLPHI